MLTPAIYRTTITHSRQAPVHHSFEYRSYSWYVDVDDLPRMPWWLRPFARFRADDHFTGPASGPLDGSLRIGWTPSSPTATSPFRTGASPHCCSHASSATCSTR